MVAAMDGEILELAEVGFDRNEGGGIDRWNGVMDERDGDEVRRPF
jgi:hypothetical protein